MKISLNGKWCTKIDPEENGLAANWPSVPLESELKIQVPGCIQQDDGLAEQYPPHDDLRNGYKGTFFMEKTVELPRSMAHM